MENDNRFPMQKLDIYQAALQLARRVHEAKIQDPELRDQATRASKSAFLNLSATTGASVVVGHTFKTRLKR
ncbi:MAG TPA: hypothetical protein VMB50_20105 [Myxococcales bacterium]|nr:hypothetical protein [Myxococcales bacterium]